MSKKFQCPICGVDYSNVARHLKVKHHVIKKSDQQNILTKLSHRLITFPPKTPCPICQKVTGFLNHHVKNVHGDPNTIEIRNKLDPLRVQIAREALLKCDPEVLKCDPDALWVSHLPKILFQAHNQTISLVLYSKCDMSSVR